MLSSGKLAPAFKVYLKMRENTRNNIRYYANCMTSLLSSELPFQTKFPCENSRDQTALEGVFSARWLGVCLCDRVSDVVQLHLVVWSSRAVV